MILSFFCSFGGKNSYSNFDREIGFAYNAYAISADINEDIQNVEYYNNGYCYSNLSSKSPNNNSY